MPSDRSTPSPPTQLRLASAFLRTRARQHPSQQRHPHSIPDQKPVRPSSAAALRKRAAILPATTNYLPPYLPTLPGPAKLLCTIRTALRTVIVRATAAVHTTAHHRTPDIDRRIPRRAIHHTQYTARAPVSSSHTGAAHHRESARRPPAVASLVGRSRSAVSPAHRDIARAESGAPARAPPLPPVLLSAVVPSPACRSPDLPLAVLPGDDHRNMTVSTTTPVPPAFDT